MAQTVVSVRVDSDLKKDFEKFCDDVGMNISTAFNVFIKAVLIQRKIPFEIALPKDVSFDKSSGRFVESSRPVGQPSSRPVNPSAP